MKIQSYRDLWVWKKAMEVVMETYRVTRGFPKEELYGVVSQMRRSVVSIPSNIAEGYGRNSTKDYIRFLQIASGSLYEFQTQLQISFNLGYLHKDSFENIYHSSNEVGRMLNSLIQKIKPHA